MYHQLVYVLEWGINGRSQFQQSHIVFKQRYRISSSQKATSTRKHLLLGFDGTDLLQNKGTYSRLITSKLRRTAVLRNIQCGTESQYRTVRVVLALNVENGGAVSYSLVTITVRSTVRAAIRHGCLSLLLT